MQIENGELQPEALEQLPKIDSSWLQRWRKAYHVSWRARTVAYKVPREKLKQRLGVLWRNCIRLRTLHRLCFGEKGKLRFRSYDQKPLFFNSLDGCRTLALRGVKDVNVKENVHATRCRFTAMTKAIQLSAGENISDACRRSNGSGDPRNIAVLFKAETDRIKTALDVPNGCLVQCGPKGSYRVEHVLDFLKWDLGKADSNDGSECEVVVLDWFSAHLDPSVDDLIKARGHVPLKLGGGSTPFVAVLDTHAHWSYEAAYKDAEVHDSAAQLRRGSVLPCTSRQTVLSRAVDSWRQVQHDRVSEGWVAAGITNALDGSDDHLLSRVVLPFWAELQMDTARQQLIAEIEDAYANGQISEWSEYENVLEPYDEHRALIEGEEAWPEEMLEPTAEDGYESPDNPDYADKLFEEDDRADEVAKLASAKDAASLQEKAQKEVAVENDKKQLEQLVAMRSTMQELGDTATKNFLDQRILDVRKRQARPNEAVSVHLRAKALERRAEEAQARAEAAAAREKWRQLQQEQKTAELALQKAKAEKSSAQAACKLRLEDAKLARAAEAQQRAEQSHIDQLTKMFFASRMANRLLNWSLETGSKSEKSALACSVAKACKQKLGEKSMPVPAFLDASRKDLKMVNPNGSKSDAKIWASEAFCWRLLNHRTPESTSALHRAPCLLLDQLLRNTCPGYESLCSKRWSGRALLEESQNIADIAFLAGVFRFSAAVGVTAFPLGLHEWPVTAAWWQDFLAASGKGSGSAAAAASTGQDG
ncbi:pip [Symbiodinium sp. CCMP2592]|nr:pip [Symbiodinium sp. CCMP2592]